LANKNDYEKKYNKSIKNNDVFWKKEGKRITWIKPYTKIKNVKYSKNEVHIKWYEDGTLNASSNCIDRHLKDKKDKTAIIWVGDNPKDTKKITYKQLHKEVSKTANGLKELGIKKGDRVTIYLTMIPELAITMLACARIGAIHSIIFGGFSPDSIAGRIDDCESDYVITADEGVRGGKIIPLKDIIDEALTKCRDIKKCNFFILCVPTPIHKDKTPNLGNLKDAIKTVSKILKKKDIIFIESTVFPGATEQCKNYLEKKTNLKNNKDFFIGYSPERVNPGDKIHTLQNITKIVAIKTVTYLVICVIFFLPASPSFCNL